MPSFLLCLRAILLGIIEGITEWLPVSSTGHLLLFEPFLSLNGEMSEEFYSFFLVAIQLGAILAVFLLYLCRLNPWAKGKTEKERKDTLRLWGRVVVGMLPSAIIGILFDEWLETHLYGSFVIACALIIYGILFILWERRQEGRESFRLESVYEISFWDALRIGGFQVLSLIPGTSRSGATILGGMLIGCSRVCAAEFSFFMAIPVMAGASLLRFLRFTLSGAGVSSREITLLLLGMLTAFLVSLAAIKALMSYVRRHSFALFGWYRIALGIVVILFGALQFLA